MEGKRATYRIENRSVSKLRASALNQYRVDEHNKWDVPAKSQMIFGLDPRRSTSVATTAINTAANKYIATPQKDAVIFLLGVLYAKEK
jgi:hypothetical protein